MTDETTPLTTNDTTVTDAAAPVVVADEVLLDNFTPDQCRQAVRLRDELAPKTKLEASGGLTLEVARAYAEAGVDYLAVGGLTHSAPALDVGMDLRAD